MNNTQLTDEAQEELNKLLKECEQQNRKPTLEEIYSIAMANMFYSLPTVRPILDKKVEK